MNKHLRSRFIERWEKLTDDELERVDGRAELLVVLLQEKYGYERERAERDLLRFLDESARGPAVRVPRVAAPSARPAPAVAPAAGR